MAYNNHQYYDQAADPRNVYASYAPYADYFAQYNHSYENGVPSYPGAYPSASSQHGHGHHGHHPNKRWGSANHRPETRTRGKKKPVSSCRFYNQGNKNPLYTQGGGNGAENEKSMNGKSGGEENLKFKDASENQPDPNNNPVRANAHNPNNPIYWTSRGMKVPKDLNEAAAEIASIKRAEGRARHVACQEKAIKNGKRKGKGLYSHHLWADKWNGQRYAFYGVPRHPNTSDGIHSSAPAASQAFSNEKAVLDRHAQIFKPIPSSDASALGSSTALGGLALSGVGSFYKNATMTSFTELFGQMKKQVKQTIIGKREDDEFFAPDEMPALSRSTSANMAPAEILDAAGRCLIKYPGVPGGVEAAEKVKAERKTKKTKAEKAAGGGEGESPSLSAFGNPDSCSSNSVSRGTSLAPSNPFTPAAFAPSARADSASPLTLNVEDTLRFKKSLNKKPLVEVETKDFVSPFLDPYRQGKLQLVPVGVSLGGAGPAMPSMVLSPVDRTSSMLSVDEHTEHTSGSYDSSASGEYGLKARSRTDVSPKEMVSETKSRNSPKGSASSGGGSPRPMGEEGSSPLGSRCRAGASLASSRNGSGTISPVLGSAACSAADKLHIAELRAKLRAGICSQQTRPKTKTGAKTAGKTKAGAKTEAKTETKTETKSSKASGAAAKQTPSSSSLALKEPNTGFFGRLFGS